MKGTFIVIDGLDGSGKKTQYDLLLKRMEAKGLRVKGVDFPQYGQFSAVFVEKYLNGHFGKADEVTPKQASLFYALDRFAAAKEMREWLESGGIIVSNRFTSASMGHQAGKISDPMKRQKFIDWLLELEFEILGIPRPDCTFFLYVPHHIGMELVKQKTSQRDYIESSKKIDIHEEDKAHMIAAEDAYLYAAERYDDWETILCTRKNTLRSIEDIHEEIWAKVEHMI